VKKQLSFQRPTPAPADRTVISAVQGATENRVGKSRLLRKVRDKQKAISFRKKTESVSLLIAFLRFSIHREPMGQQHRARIKRKRRRAYLQRKKVSKRAATPRPAPAKQQAKKESAAAE